MMNPEIKERPLIQVKTINRKLFEQIPPRKTIGDDEFLGCVAGHTMIYREKNGNLYRVHYIELPQSNREEIEKWQKWISEAPQIFLA